MSGSAVAWQLCAMSGSAVAWQLCAMSGSGVAWQLCAMSGSGVAWQLSSLPCAWQETDTVGPVLWMESEGMLDLMLLAVQLNDTYMQLEMRNSRGHFPTDLAN